jgi:hypothetical protein
VAGPAAAYEPEGTERRLGAIGCSADAGDERTHIILIGTVLTALTEEQNGGNQADLARVPHRQRHGE